MTLRQAASWMILAVAAAAIVYISMRAPEHFSAAPKPPVTAEKARPDIVVIGNLAAIENDDPKQVVESETDRSRINDYLERAGISHEYVFLPWGRAYRTVQNRNDALIFNMRRTPEREPLFHWLVSMERNEPVHLIARKGSSQEKMNPDEIRASVCKAACIAGSAQCQALRDFGFAHERIVEINESERGVAELLLLRGRVDFIAELPSDLSDLRVTEGHNTSELAIMMPISGSDSSWLAAPNSIDPALLERLLAALPPHPAKRPVH